MRHFHMQLNKVQVPVRLLVVIQQPERDFVGGDVVQRDHGAVARVGGLQQVAGRAAEHAHQQSGDKRPKRLNIE